MWQNLGKHRIATNTLSSLNYQRQNIDPKLFLEESDKHHQIVSFSLFSICDIIFNKIKEQKRLRVVERGVVSWNFETYCCII